MSRASSISLFAALLFSLSATVALAGEGKGYISVTSPQPAGGHGKVQVIEFFHYGASKSQSMETCLGPWLANPPNNVQFVRVPLLFGRQADEAYANLYYVLNALGVAERLHGSVYRAVQVDQLDLTNLQGQLDWLAKQGVDRKKFEEAYSSFPVATKVREAQKLAVSYNIAAKAIVAIDGKYLTSPDLAGSCEALPRVLNELIERESQAGDRKTIPDLKARTVPRPLLPNRE